nr:PREDICTED: facilitated trehalose transporter Tret1-like isoform X1 [Bemisia tabaci]
MTNKSGQQNGHANAEYHTVSWARETLSQILATSAKSFLLLCVGMLIGFPTVLIPVLMRNKDGDLHFSGEEASWYGSLTYIFQPAGSLLSGAMLQSFGCKKLMMLINIPQFGCWLMLYYASSNISLYISSAMVGFVIGLMEAPTIRYIGEISHPSLRGVLTTYSSMYTTIGFLVVYFLGSLTDWRHVALYSSLAPIICVLALSQVPETPMWLMSKGRSEEALHSLQWLRGWTTAEMVKDEFVKLEFYSSKKPRETLHSYEKEVDTRDEKCPSNTNGSLENGCANGAARNVNCKSSSYLNVRGKRGLAEKWNDLTRKEMVIPLCKCIVLHCISLFSGLLPLRPFLVKIFSEMELPIQANWSSVLVSLLGILGNIGCMLLINRVGKKRLAITSFGAVSLCFVFLALHLRGYSPNLGGNFDDHWWPLSLFLSLFFFYNLALQPIPWIYLSELLPYKGRGVATGIVASLFYMGIFFGVKSYPTLLENIGLDGIFYVYAAVSIGGIFYTWLVLPSTEGKFLCEIETETTQVTHNGKKVDI